MYNVNLSLVENFQREIKPARSPFDNLTKAMLSAWEQGNKVELKRLADISRLEKR